MITKLAVKYAVGTIDQTEYATGIWTLEFDGTAQSFLNGIVAGQQEACRLFAKSNGFVTQDEEGNYYSGGLSVVVKDLAILYREDI